MAGEVNFLYTQQKVRHQANAWARQCLHRMEFSPLTTVGQNPGSCRLLFRLRRTPNNSSEDYLCANENRMLGATGCRNATGKSGYRRMSPREYVPKLVSSTSPVHMRLGRSQQYHTVSSHVNRVITLEGSSPPPVS